MPRKIEISYRTIVFTVLFLLSLWLIYQIREIISSLLIAFILMAALNPIVEKMEKLKIPRPLAIIIFYILFFGFVAVVIAGIIPPLIDQTAILLERIPDYVSQINLPWFDKQTILPQLTLLSSIPQQLVKFTVDIFRNLIEIFVLAVITFYLLMERKKLGKYLAILFNNHRQEKAIDLMQRIETRLGNWVRAEIFLMIIIGVMSYVGLRILGIDFSLPLAVFAGFLEVIPNIGPTLSAIPAIISGLTISPLYGLAVTALYILVQQTENTFIVPKVMQKGLGINPLVVIICLTIGLKLGGVLGLILAVPIFLIIEEVVKEIGISDHFPKV